MRTRRIVFLLTMCAILVGLAIIGSSSWLIVNREQKQPVNQVNDDTSPCFTTEYTYDGTTDFKPVLNDVGIAVFGADAEFTITSSSANTKNAGTYYFTIVDDTTGQVVSSNHKVTVNKATPTVTATVSAVTDVSGSENADLLALGAGFVGSKVTWSIVVKGVGNDGTLGTATPSYTIQPTDFDTFSSTVQNAGNTYNATQALSTSNATYLNNYNYPSSCDYSCTVLPTCYSTVGNTKTYYGTLDQGLSKVASATSTTTLTAARTISITTTEDVDGTATAVTRAFNSIKHFKHNITTNATINSYVTLFVPYDESVTNLITYQSATSSSVPSFGNSTYELNAVTIGDGVTVTNNGTINIPAVLCGGNGGYKYNSYVVGNYSRIYMGTNSKITNSGAIGCYGFITEALDENGKLTANGSEVQMNSGTLMTVFTVTEHRGGSTFMGVAKPESSDITGAMNIGSPDYNKAYEPTLTAFPFLRFYVHSVTTLMTAGYNATVKGHAMLYADGQENETVVDLIGKSSSALLQMTNANTKISSDFDVDTLKHDLDIRGNMTLNSMKMVLVTSKTVGLTAYIVVSLNTSGTYFPISYHFDVEFMPYDGGGASTVTMTNQDVKLLPGSSLKIHEGVTVNAGKLAIYENNELLNAVSGGTVNAVAYTNNAPAEFILNGTLNVDYLGGMVKTKVSTARLNINVSNSLVSKELINAERHAASVSVLGSNIPFDKCTYGEYTLTANGLMLTGVTTTESKNLEVGTYYTSLVSQTGAFIKSTVNITLNANGGSVSPESVTVDITNNGLSNISQITSITPTKTDYKFLGWYLDSALTKALNATTATEIKFDTTLYAKWQLNMASTVVFNTDGGSEISSITVTVGPNGISSADLVKINEKIPQKSGYRFLGWYMDESCETPISASAVNAKTVNVYAKWEQYNVYYTVTLDPNLSSVDGLDSVTINGVDSNNQLTVGEGAFDGTSISIEEDNNPTVKYYLLGWSTSATATAPDSTINITANTTLYAVWAVKNQFTLVLTGNVLGLSNQTVWLKPGTTYDLTNIDAYNKLHTGDDDSTKSKYFEDVWTASGCSLSGDTVTLTESVATLTAGWSDKITVKFSVNSSASSSTYADTYYKIGDSFTTHTITVNTGWQFRTWSVSGISSLTTVDAGTSVTLPAGTASTVTFTACFNVQITFAGSDSNTYSATVSNGNYVEVGVELTIEITAATDFKIDKVSSSPSGISGSGPYKLTPTAPTTITVTTSSTSGCFAAGTLITMADGTVKPIEDLVASDVIMVYDHETGELTYMTNLFILNNGFGQYPLLKLVFSDGTTFDILFEHGLYDLDTRQYEIIGPENVESYIGHRFYMVKDGVEQEVQLVGYETGVIGTTCYSLLTPLYINHFANGLLCVSDSLEGLYNIFEYDENMMVDQEKKAADIEKYGISDYSDWAHVFTYEQYLAFNVQYYHIIIGKGLCTDADIQFYIEKYLVRFE